ncbi:MAG: DUF6476 family protein [Hyphomicrobiaceae bacterium]
MSNEAAPGAGHATDAASAAATGADVFLPAKGDPPMLRVMKIVVIVLGIALVLGFFTVIGRMIYLTARTDATSHVSASSSTPATAAAFVLPAGAEIRQMTLDGSRLALHVRDAGGGAEWIVLVDVVSGKVLNRLDIRTAPPASSPR